MKHFESSAKRDIDLFGILLKPSWLSGLLSVLIAAGLTVFAVVSARYEGSNAQLQFLNYNNETGHTTTQTIGSALASNRLISDLPLLLFWMLTGLVVYLFAINIYAAIKRAAEVADQMDGFVNVDRRRLIWDSVEKLGIRLVVLVAWIPYILLFFHRVVPFVIASAQAGSSELGSLSGASEASLGIVVMFLAVHGHVVLLRLLVLRPRLFSRALYVD